jgi:hypothetical protein
LDEQGRLAADVPCLTCRYNLRGLSPGANCPECNAPVQPSTRLPALRCAPLQWLRSVQRGLGLLIYVTAGAPLLLILSAVWMVYAAVTYQRSDRVVMPLVVAAPTLLAAAGVWAATRRVDRRFPDSPAAWVARVAVGASVVAMAPFAYMLSCQAVSGNLLVGAPSLYAASLGAATAAFSVHVGHLLEGTPSRKLARGAVGVAVLCGVTAVAVALALLGAMAEAAIFVWPGLVLGLASPVAMVILLVDARRAVRAEALLAAQWRAAQHKNAAATT